MKSSPFSPFPTLPLPHLFGSDYNKFFPVLPDNSNKRYHLLLHLIISCTGNLHST